MPEPHHAVAHRLALVNLEHAGKPLDQLGACVLELLGALPHQSLELGAPAGERELQSDLEHRGAVPDLPT